MKNVLCKSLLVACVIVRAARGQDQTALYTAPAVIQITEAQGKTRPVSVSRRTHHPTIALVPTIALTDPSSRFIYLGPEYAAYAVLTRGIVGFSLFGGNVRYDLGVVAPEKLSGLSPDKVLSAFDQGGYSDLAKNGFRGFAIPRDMEITLSEGRSRSMTFPINKVVVDGNTLTVDTSSPGGKHTARMVVDASTDAWRITQASVDGEPVDLEAERRWIEDPAYRERVIEDAVHRAKKLQDAEAARGAR